MTDAKRKKRWQRIRSPEAALAEIVKNEMFFGYDPYYADLRAALLEMAERVLRNQKK